MNLLLAYYGDDFTGSTDVMEALQWAGLRTVLFLSPPTRQQLARFEHLRAFGIAGWSRTMSPGEMEQELRPAFAALRDTGVPLVHYKVCSTFDSSPEIGSIGRALDIGRDTFGSRCVPILAGAPVLGRYTVFGNLFARSGLDTEPFRLDRHPAMRQHPITPMDESDLRLHLGRQTRLKVGSMDVLRLADADTDGRLRDVLASDPDAVLFDVLYPSHLAAIGRSIEAMREGGRPLFAVGSSGIEYALTAWWDASGRMDGLRSHAAGQPAFGPVRQLAIVTGSCSPVNDRQVAWALQHGFAEVPLNTARLIDPETSGREIEASVRRGRELVDRGASVLLHSSRGPDDPRVDETLRQLAALGLDPLDAKLKSGRILGPQLGRILKGVIAGSGLARVGVAGGDTSGYVARELGLEALEAIAPVAPGSPLCRAHAPSSGVDGLEIVFKGGQVGRTDFYGTLLHGTAA
jgi:3-oxoisoapionate kinase